MNTNTQLPEKKQLKQQLKQEHKQDKERRAYKRETMTNLRNLNQNHPMWDFINEMNNNGASSSRAWPNSGEQEVPIESSDEETQPSPPAQNDESDDPPEVVPEDPHRREGRRGHRHERRERRGLGHGRFGPGRGGFGHPGLHHGPHAGPHGGPHGHGGPQCGRGGPAFRGRFPFGVRGGPPGTFPIDLPALATWIQSNFLGGQGPVRNTNVEGQDFTPAIDLFSTSEAYVVHVSLPGASKQDIAVNWNQESSTLILSGIIHRPGDEELLKTLELGERQIGAFERKVVLGTEAEPAKVYEDGINARLEEGVLRIEVPKMRREEEYVQVRKVDIE